MGSNEWSCWAPPFDYVFDQIPTEFPQVWRSESVESEENKQLIVTKKRAMEMCWGWTDSNGEIQSRNGGYFTAIETGYEGKLAMMKWVDVGSQYGKDDDCRTG